MEYSTGPSATFHPFTRLPAELRLVVWQYSLPTRILTVRTLPTPSPHPWGRPAFATLEPQPALLSVCRESRTVALRVYALIKDPYGPRFYFNSDRDTLFFDVECPSWITILSDLRYQRSTPVAAVRSIALMHETMPPGVFAATVLRCGILEVFIVGRYYIAGMPDVWPLVPRVLENNGMSLEIYKDVDFHLRIIRRLLEIAAREEPVEGRIPTVTAVNREVWQNKGLSLRGKWV
jgi:hypothetical protein